MPKLYVIGFGFKPFDGNIIKILLDTDFILASERLFDFFLGLEAYDKVKDKVRVINNVDKTFEFIKSNPHAKIVLLASGDPLFYGIGRRAVEELGKDSVEILPDLSSIQVAFARIKESWDNAFLMSLHGGPDPNKRRKMQYDITDLPRLLLNHPKIAILTDKENNPQNIAHIIINSSELSERLKENIKMYVCEKLGYPDETITEAAPSQIAQKQFRNPNLVIILNKNQATTYKKSNLIFGLTEDEILHTNGLITKDEVRAISIHKLSLLNKGVFWDVGAGSGSISIEIALLCPEMQIYAIEKDPLQIENILNNKDNFQLHNLHIIFGEALSVFEGLPLPQRVFIGGSGGRLEEIIKFISEKSVEIIVINATTIETLNKSILSLDGLGYSVDVTQVNVSRMRKIGNSNYFSALNPVFIIRGKAR